MVETIIYHNDTDGVFSAAVYMFYNRSVDFDLLPIESSSRSDLPNIIERLSTKVIVLDYAYDKGAKFWCDHHYSEQFGKGTIETDRMVYDPSSKSNASLLFKYLTMDKDRLLKDMSNAINLVDMVDSAGYSSADYVFMSMDPIMKIKRYIDVFNKPNTTETLNRLVKLLCRHNFDLDKVCNDLNVDHRKYQVKQLRDVVNLGYKADVEDGIAFYYVESSLVEPPRYSEYFVYDDVKAGVRIRYTDSDVCNVSIGTNPWKSSIGHVGDFIRSLDYVKGGGHIGVGGLTIHPSDLDKLKEDIIKFFKGQYYGEVCS